MRHCCDKVFHTSRYGLYGDDLPLLAQYGAFETPEGKERLGKIAVLTAEEAVPGRELPLYPVRRWRKSLDDLAEAYELSDGGGGGWLARRAFEKCNRRVTSAEANIDGYLDKAIRKYGLEEAWETFESLSDENVALIDRLMSSE